MKTACAALLLVLGGVYFVRADSPDSDTNVAGGIGPDVVVSMIYETLTWGQEGGISAFSVGTRSCNVGDQDLLWQPSSSPYYSNQHPVISQGLFRLKDGRLTQIGMSWLKHGFYALNEEFGCAADCSLEQDGYVLRPGCSDPYTASLNGGRSSMGPTWEVNAHLGTFPANHTFPASTASQIPNRLQVHNTDLDAALNAGAEYFAQAQYVHPGDAASGNGDNNASYIGIGVSYNVPTARYNLSLIQPTQIGMPVIRAWKADDATVVETEARVPDEGLFILAAKAVDRGDGYWRYEYALENLNSDRSGGSFTVPLPPGIIVENIGFHDVDYHDGDGTECEGCTCLGGANVGMSCDRNSECPGSSCGGGTRLNFDGTDWPATHSAGDITWATTPFAENHNANALRWSTLYNFYFDANRPPTDTSVVLGLFKPGFPSELAIRTIGPLQGLIDCQPNGVPDECDIDCGQPECVPPCGGSEDCNANWVPDECEDDCQPNGIADSCDIRDGTSDDCQPNSVPDECEPDCDEDGIPDTCETDTEADDDCIHDCEDDCPATTPPAACCPPLDQLVVCCFPNQLYIEVTWASCLTFGGMPVCDEFPMCPGTPCRETSCRGGCLMGDYDGDGDLDLADASQLAMCFSGATGNPAYVAPSDECRLRFDWEPDGDVDLDDYEAFYAAYEGP